MFHPTRWNADLTSEEHSVLDGLTDPDRIQCFLDETPYSDEPIYRCPRSVLRDRKAHCFDGACLAALALLRLGHRPLLVDLRAHRDDDHVLAVYRRDGAWGCVSKSNVALLRYREPIFRSLRELVMSFFEFYYNLDYEKSLREYSPPIDLRRFDALDWPLRDAAMDAIAERLDRVAHRPLLTPTQLAGLRRMDQRSYDAGLLGANWAGLYKP